MNNWQPHISCPKCKSRNVIYNKTSNTWWCRKCGCVYDKTGKIIKGP